MSDVLRVMDAVLKREQPEAANRIVRQLARGCKVALADFRWGKPSGGGREIAGRAWGKTLDQIRFALRDQSR